MAVIRNTNSNTLLSGTKDNDTIQNGGWWDSSWHAGGSEVTISGVDGDDSIRNRGENVTIYGGAGNDSIGNGGNSVTISGGAGNDSIENRASNVTISGGDGDDSIRNFGSNVTITGGAGNDKIVNDGDYVTISGSKGSDTIFNGCYRQSDGSIYYYADSLGYGENLLVKYSSGDGNDVIYGFKSNSTLSIGGGSYSTKKSGDNIIVTVGEGKISLMGAASLSSVNIKVTSGGGSTDTTPSDSTLKIVTNSTPSPVTVGSAVKTVDASTRTKAVKITGNALANSIKGGSNNDTLSDGDNNDTLYGGDGNDVFIFSAGNDIIADYVAGQDKIKLSNATITGSTVSGDNVIFTLNTGKITVTGGKDKDITIIDANGNETTKKYNPTNGKTLTVTKNVTLGSSYQNADASKLTKAVQIIGNGLNNSIRGGTKNDNLQGKDGNDSIYGNAGNDKLYGQSGNDSLYGGSGNDSLWGGFGNDTLKGSDGNDKIYGGAGADKFYGDKGNDTLNGGAGNDSLWGGDGADTFIYSSGGGNDVIFGFDSKDTLTLDSLDFTATYKNKVITLNFDEVFVTLKDFGSTKTFHINDETYQISGSKFVKK